MEIKTVAVIGVGTMGSGIAYTCASKGYTVRICDRDNATLQLGLKKIREDVISGVNRGKLSPKQAEELMKRIESNSDIAKAVGNADLVIEAIYEDMSLKKEIFRKVDETLETRSIIASNTSSLSITELASATKHPERCLGMHFFNPVPAMRLVEIVLGRQTSDEAKAVAEDFARKLGKEPVIAKDSPGFIVNRVIAPMFNEAVWLLHDRLASPEDIDKALVLGASFPQGPLRLADYVGLDVALATLNTLHKTLGEKFKPCPLLEEKVRRGELGLKTRKGFYEY